MKEEGYGVILTSEYKILYFEYNVDDTLDINTKAGPQNLKTVAIFNDNFPINIISYDFNYNDGSFMYLDQARTLRRVVIQEITPPEERVDW